VTGRKQVETEYNQRGWEMERQSYHAKSLTSLCEVIQEPPQLLQLAESRMQQDSLGYGQRRRKRHGRR